MLDKIIAIRLGGEQRRKLEEMTQDGYSSMSQWLRDRINGEYEAWSAKREQEDAAAREALSQEELRMAKNLNLRPSQYLRGKRKK